MSGNKCVIFRVFITRHLCRGTPLKGAPHEDGFSFSLRGRHGRPHQPQPHDRFGRWADGRLPADAGRHGPVCAGGDCASASADRDQAHGQLPQASGGQDRRPHGRARRREGSARERPAGARVGWHDDVPHARADVQGPCRSAHDRASDHGTKHPPNQHQNQSVRARRHGHPDGW